MKNWLHRRAKSACKKSGKRSRYNLFDGCEFGYIANMDNWIFKDVETSNGAKREVQIEPFLKMEIIGMWQFPWEPCGLGHQRCYHRTAVWMLDYAIESCYHWMLWLRNWIMLPPAANNFVTFNRPCRESKVALNARLFHNPAAFYNVFYCKRSFQGLEFNPDPRIFRGLAGA